MNWIWGSILAAGAYFTFFMLLRRQWNKIPSFPPSIAKNPIKFSVIVPVRNEAKHIPNALQALIQQDYPPRYFEVIVVDDHSEDSTYQVASAYQRDYPWVRVLQLPPHMKGKKDAITHGIAHARHPYIALTDGDCIPPQKWLASLSSVASGHHLVAGPIDIKAHSIWGHLQALEQWGLVAVGAAFLQWGRPTMVNGGNMAFSKMAFEKVGGYSGIQGFAAGDDEMLAHRIHYQCGGQSIFVKHPAGCIQTTPSSHPSQWWHQRRRWAAATRRYEYTTGRWTAWGTALYHWLVLACLISALTGSTPWPWIILSVGKGLGELALLIPTLRHYGRSRLVTYYPLGLLYYTFYVPLMSAWAIFGPKSFRWKGRNVQ